MSDQLGRLGQVREAVSRSSLTRETIEKVLEVDSQTCPSSPTSAGSSGEESNSSHPDGEATAQIYLNAAERICEAERGYTSAGLKPVVPIDAEEVPSGTRLDSAPRRRRRGRSAATTILHARTGLALANGAKSTAAAMIEAGYSPATAHNPAAKGITPARALAAAAEVFPGATSATSIKRDGLELVNQAMLKARNDPGTRPLELAQIGGGAAKLGHDIGGGDDQDADLAAAAAHEAFNVHTAQRDLTLALRITAAGADVPAILQQLQDDLDAAQQSQAAFELRHGTKVRR